MNRKSGCLTSLFWFVVGVITLTAAMMYGMSGELPDILDVLAFLAGGQMVVIASVQDDEWRNDARARLVVGYFGEKHMAQFSGCGPSAAEYSFKTILVDGVIYIPDPRTRDTDSPASRHWIPANPQPPADRVKAVAQKAKTTAFVKMADITPKGRVASALATLNLYPDFYHRAIAKAAQLLTARGWPFAEYLSSNASGSTIWVVPLGNSEARVTVTRNGEIY